MAQKNDDPSRAKWNQIIDQIRQLDASFRQDGSYAWFRGERRVADDWLLKSTLHRHVEDLLRDARVSPDAAFLRQEASRLFRRFKADAWSLLNGRERSDWGIAFAMQHFGIPTRLLDWTESLACAVFFAQLHRGRDDAAAIWILDPQALNSLTIDNDELLPLDDEAKHPNVDVRLWHPRFGSNQDLPSVAAAPVFTNRRMVAQRAAFVLTGDSFRPLDQQPAGARLVADGRLVKLELPPDIHDDADAYLETADLTAFTFYPDLEGLALKQRAEAARQVRDAKHHYPTLFD